MSTLLPSIDLTGAIVGTQKTLDFTRFMKFNPANIQEKAHIAVFNESGCGCNLVMQASADSQYLPAGGWTVFEIEPNDNSMLITVTYTLPNPPVSQLNAVYYLPGEQTPTAYTLGNSPIGIGGSVQTSNIQTLSNEGSASNLLVIDMGDTAFNQLFTLYNDGHGLWYVDQSGTKHQVIKVNTSGNPLQLGVSGDITEVLGNLKADGTLESGGNATMDGTLTVTGDATFNGASNGISVTNNALISGNETVSGTLTVTGDASLNGSGTGLAVANNQTVGGTLTSTGAVNANGGVTLPNATFLKMKDHTGSAQSVLEVDSGDIIRMFLTSLGDRLLIEDSAQSEVYLDLQPNAIIIGDATALLPVDIRGTTTLDYGGTNTISTDGAGRLTVGGAGTALTVNNNATISGTLTAGGVKTNTIKDNVNGNTAFDLSAGDGSATMTHPLTTTQVLLATGSFSRVAKSGPFTLATTGTSCAHGLGATPDFVIAVNDAGGSSGAIANAVNFGTMTSTNVTVYSASGAPVVRLIAFKF